MSSLLACLPFYNKGTDVRNLEITDSDGLVSELHEMGNENLETFSRAFSLASECPGGEARVAACRLIVALIRHTSDCPNDTE